MLRGAIISIDNEPLKRQTNCLFAMKVYRKELKAEKMILDVAK
jgi:hypothetical protein